jgi:hypothetical protein
VFSPNETKVLEVLGSRKMKLTEIASKVFGRKNDLLNPNNSVAYCVLSINKKCKKNKLDWHIKGYGLGRNGKLIWKEDRNAKQ